MRRRASVQEAESTTVTDPRRHRSDLPDALVDVLIAACSFPPRYATAEDMRLALVAASKAGRVAVP